MEAQRNGSIPEKMLKRSFQRGQPDHDSFLFHPGATTEISELGNFLPFPVFTEPHICRLKGLKVRALELSVISPNPGSLSSSDPRRVLIYQSLSFFN